MTTEPTPPVPAGWLESHFGLAGRTALVAGARTGIGRACALALAAAGSDVALWGRAEGDRDAVAALAARVAADRRTPVHAHVLAVDGGWLAR